MPNTDDDCSWCNIGLNQEAIPVHNGSILHLWQAFDRVYYNSECAVDLACLARVAGLDFETWPAASAEPPAAPVASSAAGTEVHSTPVLATAEHLGFVVVAAGAVVTRRVRPA